MTDVDCAAERVAQILDRVLLLEYATVTPELQAAHQLESAPMHRPDAGPVLNGFYEQARASSQGGYLANSNCLARLQCT